MKVVGCCIWLRRLELCNQGKQRDKLLRRTDTWSARSVCGWSTARLIPVGRLKWGEEAWRLRDDGLSSGGKITLDLVKFNNEVETKITLWFKGGVGIKSEVIEVNHKSQSWRGQIFDENWSNVIVRGMQPIVRRLRGLGNGVSSYYAAINPVPSKFLAWLIKGRGRGTTVMDMIWDDSEEEANSHQKWRQVDLVVIRM